MSEESVDIQEYMAAKAEAAGRIHGGERRGVHVGITISLPRGVSSSVLSLPASLGLQSPLKSLGLPWLSALIEHRNPATKAHFLCLWLTVFPDFSPVQEQLLLQQGGSGVWLLK